MVSDGKAQAKIIDAKLDQLLDPMIPKLREKYTKKNELID